MLPTPGVTIPGISPPPAGGGAQGPAPQPGPQPAPQPGPGPFPQGPHPVYGARRPAPAPATAFPAGAEAVGAPGGAGVAGAPGTPGAPGASATPGAPGATGAPGIAPQAPPAASAPLAPGEYIVGSYRLGRTLGSGSFGKVKLATHIPTGIQVAVKILNKAKIKQMNMEAKVAREIKIMRLFHHPHVLNLYEVYETPTEIFLFIEYAEHGELFTYIVKRKTIDVDEARRYFQQLISAINYCHKRVAVLHRDIKPENLLLAKGNNLKLSDFGLSNMLSEGEFLKTSCGSPNYASSEIVAGSEYVGPPADIWSCGCVLYTLLVGRLPFDDPYVPSLFRKIKTGEYTIPTWVDPMAADLIRGMLCVNVDRRLTVEQIKVHPWFQINLPRYLRVNFDLDLSEIDEEIRMSRLGEDIAQRMAELHYSLPDVLRDMKGGVINDGVVSYKLILGTVYDDVFGAMTADGAAKGAQGPEGPGAQGALASAAGRGCQGVNLALDSNLLGTALLAPDNAHEFSGVHYEMYANKVEESSISNEERRRQREERRQRSNFYFGVKLCEVSSRYPYEVMLSMIDTVRRLGFRWRVGGFIATRYYDRSQGSDNVTLKLDNSKIKNPYTLTIKCASPMNQFENDLIIGLTLYTAYDQRSCSYYMVDLRKVMGEVAFFLYTAQSLGAALAEALS